MTLSWVAPGLATSLASLRAQKPEWGAGAYPRTSGKRPGWRQIEQAGCWQGPDVSLVVPTDTCEALCNCFLTFCSALWQGPG